MYLVHIRASVQVLAWRSCASKTGRSLKQRYSEHIRYIRCNKPRTAYASHILLPAHELGSVQNTMTLIVQRATKETFMGTPGAIFYSTILSWTQIDSRTVTRGNQTFVYIAFWWANTSRHSPNWFMRPLRCSVWQMPRNILHSAL